jgi:hypothetical protein
MLGGAGAHLVIAALMLKFYRLLLHIEFEMWDMTETRIELYHKFQNEISGTQVEFDGKLDQKLQNNWALLEELDGQTH